MTSQPPKFKSLSRQIVTRFCLFTLLLSIVHGLISLVLMYTLEDSFIEKDILQEAAYLSDEYQRSGQWPTVRKANMQLHFSKQSFPDDIRQLAIQEPRRKEFYGQSDRHYHLHTLAGFDSVYLLAEVSGDLLVRPIRDGVIQFLTISGIFVTIIACLIAWLIGRKATQPLKQLAELVDGVAPQNVPAKFADQFPNNEIGILARTLEHSLLRMTQALEREKCFTRDVSHELRSPLAIIKNASELQLSKRGDSPSDKAVTKRILEGAEQMERTVYTLLALAREEHTHAHKKEVNLMPLIEASVLDHRRLLEGKDVEVDIHDACNTSVLAQPDMLKVLLDNLLSNAFQYTGSGKVSVNFSEGKLFIKDTGPGIEAAISDQITEPAIKGSQSTGFGFGLSIVKRLCEHQGWQLVVQSDQGTTISVAL